VPLFQRVNLFVYFFKSFIYRAILDKPVRILPKLKNTSRCSYPYGAFAIFNDVSDGALPIVTESSAMLLNHFTWLVFRSMKAIPGLSKTSQSLFCLSRKMFLRYDLPNAFW
jgi:hypothetical protein